MIRRIKLLTLIILLLHCCTAALVTTSAEITNYIRVAIIQDTASLSLKTSGLFEITDINSRDVLYRGKNLKTTVTAYKGGILLAGKTFNLTKIVLSINEPDVAIINGRKFKGNIQFIKKDNLHLLVVNQINLEDYIKGILYHESSHYWPIEALKAQAIASRTYAVYQMQENRAKDFDVTSDVYSQVYGGSTSERYRTNKAVEETLALIITYQDKPIPAYFHATCAGHTEDASVLWKTDLAPLKGVACDFCKESPHYNWHYVIFIGELREELKNAGYNLGMIKEIQILGRNNSGRVTELNLVTDRNELKIPAKDLRNIVGPDLIRSTKFNVSIEGQDAIFEGSGWGHGVGLCQWGAYFMAKQGWEAKKILQYYYPGTDVKTLGF